MTRRAGGLSFTLLTALIAVLMTGCGSEKKSKKELVFAQSAELRSADVQQIDMTFLANFLTTSSILNYSLDLKQLLPGYAESFEIAPDGKSITFKLPKDAKLSNNTPLTAEVVKKSFERFIKECPMGSSLEGIKNYVIKDPQTLTLEFEKPPAFMMASLASYFTVALDPNLAESMGKQEFGRKPVYNGLFQMDEYAQGSQYVLTRNPNYRTFTPFVENKGPAKIEKITVRVIPEDFTRVAELEAGHVDLIEDVPTASLDSLRKNPDIQFFEYNKPGVQIIDVNTKLAPLNDLNVRRAIAIAIDRDELNQTMNGTVTPWYSLLAPSQFCYDESVAKSLQEKLKFNLEEAKSLLAKSGWKDTNGDGILEKNGKPLSLRLQHTNYTKQSLPMVQTQLKKIGIDIKLQELEGGYLFSQILSGNYDLIMDNYEWTEPDILNYMMGRGKYLNWNNKEVDKLFEEGRYVMDLKNRATFYNKAQVMILDELPVIPLYYGKNQWAARKSLKGIKIGVDGTLYFNDMDKD